MIPPEPMDDPFPDEFPMDDAGVLAICEARLWARERGEFPPTELQAYQLIRRWAPIVEAAKAQAEASERTQRALAQALLNPGDQDCAQAFTRANQDREYASQATERSVRAAARTMEGK